MKTQKVKSSEKTVLEWLKTLDEPQRSEATKEAKKSFIIGPVAYNVVKSKSQAVAELFFFLTEKGSEYWINVYKKVLKEERMDYIKREK